MPDIAIWNKCNNKCIMCTNPGSFSAGDSSSYSLKVQIKKMENYLARGGVYLKNADKAGFMSLTGGEPTSHPDFLSLLSYFRKRMPGTRITLLSNGRWFSSAALTARFLKIAKPPFAVGIALHAPDAKTHDSVAGVRGSFSQTVSGLKNLLSMKGAQEVEIRLILHAKTIGAFRSTLEFLYETFPDPGAFGVIVIHYEIEGMSQENHRAISLNLSRSAKVVNSNADFIKKFPRFALYHFPLCLIAEKLRPLCRVTLPQEDRVYPPACGRCALRKKCLGLMLEYYRKFGASELKPVRVRA